jgi:hypothetical protein
MIADKVGLLVCGSRCVGGWDYNANAYTNEQHLKQVRQSIARVVEILLDKKVVKSKAKIIIISGAAKGPDDIAMRYANRNSIPCITFPAQWEEYGKRAGFIRNSEMLKYAEYVLAFYDGTSKGTAHTLREAKRLGLPNKTVLIDC